LLRSRPVSVREALEMGRTVKDVEVRKSTLPGSE
jgi:hypothetical protein